MPREISEPNSDPDYYDMYEAKGMAHYFKSGGGGFAYEDKLYYQYKQIGLVPPSFVPAGAANDLPDLMLEVAPSTKSAGGTPAKAKKRIKLEVKLDTAADFGQSGLKCKPDGTWYLDGQDSPEGRQMRSLLNAMGVPRIVQREWGPAGRPKIFSHTGAAKDMSQRDLDYDRENFKDIILKGSDAPQVQTLFSYYGTKSTHYIQIGGYGLYSMSSDPAGLSTIGVKKFDGTLKLRIRRKPSGSRTEPWKYRFSTALLIDRKPSVSNFDLDQLSDDDALYFLDPAFKVVR
jgi:hypothetical protein